MKRRSFFALVTGSLTAVVAAIWKKTPSIPNLIGKNECFMRWPEDGGLPSTWDEYPIRYKFIDGQYVKVEPLVEVSTTTGKKMEINPEWMDAPMEVKQTVTVSTPGIQEVQWWIDKRA